MLLMFAMVGSGSSKEPIKPADRGNIEYLYERSKEYIKEIEDFCQRDYFYSYNNLLQRKVTYPIANIYGAVLGIVVGAVPIHR